MEKQIYKIGDKVFDIFYGHGEIIKIVHDDYHYPIRVNFFGKGLIISFTEDGRFDLNDNYPRLSFTKYTLEGFSEIRPINYSDYIGKWGKFWNKGDYENVAIDCLNSLSTDDEDVEKFVPYTEYKLYDYYVPLTEEQLKILDLK